MKLLTSSALAFALAAPAYARTFTVYNGCPFTVWPAMFTGDTANGVPSYTTGWEADAYTAVSFDVPDTWTAGRIWARRDCTFDGSTSPNTCLDGGCNGGLVCDPTTGTGVPPATLAEFTLSPTGQDNYDVSLVDGYNLPLSITNTVGCPEPGCFVDLGPNCPAPYQGPYDSTGFPVGCQSACNVDPDPSNSPACCSGQYDTPATCPSSGDPTYSYFKSNCPNTYAYAYDESSGTALWTCPGTSAADYTITFCPPA
ncbi:thaumatin-like protein [Calocera cornea HHB12733]|uniref:Thaumatin-like protein n=1 Tax=Calocera cornea HHB12733 TaxID=1353952 RepID=A0A165GT91_9BASI|nr:thaumatin-like protein [Calocera cornea HHB12733]